ncbi:hypothetical protein L914_21271, partial [Phytophthora nicotianae]
TRVCATLDGKYLLGFVTKPNFNGISDEESEESGSDMSDVDDSPKSNPAEDAQVDFDAVDHDESDDDLKPPSGSDDKDSDESSDSSAKAKKLPVVRPINHRKMRKERQRAARA